MLGKKVKVRNPNPFRVGLKLMDGLREVVVHPNSFVTLDSDDVYFLNNMCTLFQRKILLVEDDEINEDLGLKVKDTEEIEIIGLSDKEIEELLKGNILKLKKELGQVTEKHIIDKVIRVAKGIEDLHVNKIKYLSEFSGYDFEQIIKTDDEDKK